MDVILLNFMKKSLFLCDGQGTLTLLHSERPKLYAILASLSVIGIDFYHSFFSCDGQGTVRQAILWVDRSYFSAWSNLALNIMTATCLRSPAICK